VEGEGGERESVDLTGREEVDELCRERERHWPRRAGRAAGSPFDELRGRGGETCVPRERLQKIEAWSLLIFFVQPRGVNTRARSLSPRLLPHA
jgi:hypothetical protein